MYKHVKCGNYAELVESGCLCLEGGAGICQRVVREGSCWGGDGLWGMKSGRHSEFRWTEVLTRMIFTTYMGGNSGRGERVGVGGRWLRGTAGGEKAQSRDAGSAETHGRQRPG